MSDHQEVPMSIIEARQALRALANQEAMVPVHREAFNEALKALEQALALDFLDRLDTVKNHPNARDFDDTMQDIADFEDEVRQEHKVGWFRGVGYEPMDGG